MAPRSIGQLVFAKVYPLYIQKAERKKRTKAEVDAIISWLTGYDAAGLQEQIDRQSSFGIFFAEAPALNPQAESITGVVCGVRLELIEDPLTRQIRCLDKLIDELAKGRPLSKILRT